MLNSNLPNEANFIAAAWLAGHPAVTLKRRLALIPTGACQFFHMQPPMRIPLSCNSVRQTL